DLTDRFAGPHDNLRRDTMHAKRLRLRIERIAQSAFVAPLLRDAEKRRLRLERTGQSAAEAGRAVRGRHSIATNQNAHKVKPCGQSRACKSRSPHRSAEAERKRAEFSGRQNIG